MRRCGGNSKAFPDVTPGQALCESGFFQTTVFCFKRVCSAVHHPSSPRACVPLDLFLLLFSGRILGVPLSIRCSRSRWAGKKHFRVIGGLWGVGVAVWNGCVVFPLNLGLTALLYACMGGG